MTFRVAASRPDTFAVVTWALAAAVLLWCARVSFGRAPAARSPRVEPGQVAGTAPSPPAPYARSTERVADGAVRPPQEQPRPRVLEAPSLQHPITAEHLRMYRDVDLLDAAWRALEHGDFAQARATLAQHAREYPNAAGDDLQDGLTILADCMQRPTAATRERAQRFYDEQTQSMARRRIRRACLAPR